MGRKNQIRKAQKKSRKNPLDKSKPFDLYFLVISTIIIIPLIFSRKTLDPDLGPRLLALGIVIFLISAYYITRSLKNRPDLSFVKLLIFPVFVLYLLASVFSMTQAVNPTEGLYDIAKTFLTILLLIYATLIFIKYKNFSDILTKAVILSSVIATSIGLYQYFVNVPGNTGSELLKSLYSVKGLMAHKNQFVISMFLMLPFTTYGLYKYKKLWMAVSALQTLMILLNIVILQTRSVWVATVVFGVVFFISWLIFTINKKESKKAISLKQGLIIGAIILIVVSGSAVVFKQTGTVALLQHKVSSLFDSKSHDNQGRLKMWESTWDLANDNFVFGVGAGNWKISVLPYYNANFGSNYQNWRRPHNDFLWVLSEKGILGLIFYILIFVMTFIYAVKILLKETDRDKLMFTSLLISGISGYFIVALFTFPLERINHQIYLTIMMAGIISTYYKKNTNLTWNNNKYIGFNIAILVMVAATIYYSTVMINSELYMQKMLVERNANNWKLVKKYAEKAYTPITTIDAYSMPIHLHKGVANVKMRNRKQAFEDFKIAYNYFPTQIAVLNNLAIVSAEMNNLDTAIFYFNQALEIFPNYKTSSWNLVKAYYKKADYENAYVAFLNYSPDKTPDDYNRLKNDLIHRINTSK